MKSHKFSSVILYLCVGWQRFTRELFFSIELRLRRYIWRILTRAIGCLHVWHNYDKDFICVIFGMNALWADNVKRITFNGKITNEVIKIWILMKIFTWARNFSSWYSIRELETFRYFVWNSYWTSPLCPIFHNLLKSIYQTAIQCHIIVILLWIVS